MPADRSPPRGSGRKPARAAPRATPARSRARADAVAAPAVAPADADGSHWTFLTNYSHVLLLLSRNPTVVLREVARHVGITERAVQRIIADLEAARIIEREKVGRQNHYLIQVNQHLRHPIASHVTVGDFLALINKEPR